MPPFLVLKLVRFYIQLTGITFDFSAMEPHVDHYIIMGYAYYYQGSSNTGPCDPLYRFGSNYNYTLSKALHITLAMAVQKTS